MTASDRLEMGRFLIVCQGTIERNAAADAGVREHVELVFHERDERRHDDGRTGQEQGRQLVAKRFAGSGRENAKRILAVHHPPDDLFLAGLKELVTEVPTQRLVEVDVDRHDVFSKTFLEKERKRENWGAFGVF